MTKTGLDTKGILSRSWKFSNGDINSIGFRAVDADWKLLMKMLALRQASPPSSGVPPSPHAPPPHLQFPDVLPQSAKVPRILNLDSTREFVIGYVRKSAR